MTQNTEQNESVDLLKTTDASAWAAQFNATAIQLGYSSMDVAWLVGWFANAMGVAELRVKANTTLSAELNKAAEARGAEEQRQKDAEGQKPVGFLVTEHETGRVNFLKHPVSPEDMSEYELTAEAVYTRPVNVTALEARIAELTEAEQLARADAKASKARSGKDQEVIRWLAGKLEETDPMAKADYELIARASLTREGGVW